MKQGRSTRAWYVTGLGCVALMVLGGGVSLSASASPVPEAPGREAWGFRAELAQPIVRQIRSHWQLTDAYGLSGNLETVKADLADFLGDGKRLTLKKGKVEGRESYRVETDAAGNVTLTAEDDEGIRRAVYWFEDRVQAGETCGNVVRKPWLRHRISRCFFGPIKRPPFYRDELMDDIDYYPDAYLNRLAHEGVNGLWLTIELRNLVETSFNKRDKDAGRRIAKLRQTVAKCNRYGIRTWIFCIEPRSMGKDDPLLKACPGLTTGSKGWDAKGVLCPSTAVGRQYIEEAVRDLFTQVPGLPGILNISHGERPTTCLSPIDAVYGTRKSHCPNCDKLKPWEIHYRTAESFVKGMRAVEPEAEFLSWFYQPYVEYPRDTWVGDVARHLPEGVTMIYNFESGAVKDQLGHYRAGGDYWLSYAGPAPSFREIAEASREVNGRIGAKIQVGCSHECATVPFVPVPGLLYRKYKAMKAARCSSVMQCWYFGNYPGVMNKAAGELAFSDFSETEEEFLESLARPEWGEDAPVVAKLWRDFSDAYAEYPMSNDMQYYGPFHAGVAWPLEPYLKLKPLGRTWKPQDAPSGDAIGECLENHTLSEAAILASRMARGTRAKDVSGKDVLEVLAQKYAGNKERLRDLGVVRALQTLFASGENIFNFYRARARAITASRLHGETATAQGALKEMRECLAREEATTRAMLPIAEDDSRIGFHSEAEAHQFFPAKLRWRLEELARAKKELDAIDAALAKGEAYPLSEHEKQMPALTEGVWSNIGGGCRMRFSFGQDGNLTIEGEVPNRDTLQLYTFDLCATTFMRQMRLFPDGKWSTQQYNVVTPSHEVVDYKVTPVGKGWKFALELDARGWGDDVALRPAWLLVRRQYSTLWPATKTHPEGRLNIGNLTPDQFGRLVTRAGQCAQVAARGEVKVTPNHADAQYACGEMATISMTIMGTNGVPLRAGKVSVTTDDFGSKTLVPTFTADLAEGNPICVNVTRATPGFARIVLRSCDTNVLSLAGNPLVRGSGSLPYVYGVAFDAAKITPGTPDVADFDTFWQEAVKKLDATVPADVRLEEQPAAKGFRKYRISAATAGGRRVWGWITEPADDTKGPYPVHITVAGAGIGFQAGSGGEAGRIICHLNVHSYAQAEGSGPAADAERKRLYDDQNARLAKVDGLTWYWQAGIHRSREDYFYYPVILGLNRLTDWLATRPNVDRTKMTYVGTSQGGGMGLALMYLNRYIARGVIAVPAITDLMGYKVEGRQSGWPQLFEGLPADKRVAAERHAPYFCGVNFARRIHKPIRFIVGYADRTCSPSAVCAAYNVCPSTDKQLLHGLGMSHSVFGDFYSYCSAWEREAEVGKTDLRFLAFNIWGDFFGNPVHERDADEAAIIRSWNPDVVALQEATPNFWKSRLFTSLTNVYSVAGRGIGCHPQYENANNPVLYRTSRFTRVAEGSEWFCPELDGSKGMVWAVLADKTSGKRLAVFASHFWWRYDGRGDDWVRRDNARRLHEKMTELAKKYDAIVLGGGDLNSAMEHAAMKYLVSAGWSDAQKTALISPRTFPSEHGDPRRDTLRQYRGIPAVRQMCGVAPTFLWLDHIFYDAARLTACRFDLDISPEACAVSDHHPIICDFRFR